MITRAPKHTVIKQGWLSNIFYHSLGLSKYCLLKSDCRLSERLRDAPHKLWVCLSKKEGKVIDAHCSCMANEFYLQSCCCSSILYRKAAMRLGLTNPACTTKACEWLPNRKDVRPIKIKDLNLNRDDFGKRGKKRQKIISTPKKNYDPLIDSNRKALNFKDISTALEKVIPKSVLSTVMLKPKIDFIREVVSVKDISTDITLLFCCQSQWRNF